MIPIANIPLTEIKHFSTKIYFKVLSISYYVKCQICLSISTIISFESMVFIQLFLNRLQTDNFYSMNCLYCMSIGFCYLNAQENSIVMQKDVASRLSKFGHTSEEWSTVVSVF